MEEFGEDDRAAQAEFWRAKARTVMEQAERCESMPEREQLLKLAEQYLLLAEAIGHRDVQATGPEEKPTN